MPLSANLFRLESSILTRAKRATSRNNVATEKRIPPKKFWRPIVPAPKCPAPKRRRRIGGAETYLTPINNLKNNKSPSADGIPVELLKYGGTTLFTSLHQLIQGLWQTEDVP